MIELAIVSLGGGLALVAFAAAIAVTHLRAMAAHVERQQHRLEELIDRASRELRHVAGDVDQLKASTPSAVRVRDAAVDVATTPGLPRARVVRMGR